MDTRIGDRLQGAPAGIAGELSPITEGLGLTQTIRDYLLGLQDIAEHLLQEMAALESEGVYDQEPTPSWEQRQGSGAYLRLVYPTNGQVRRKEYVGANKEKIEAALARVERTRQHRRLKARFASLRAHVSQITTRQLRDACMELSRATELWGRDHNPGGVVVTPIEKVR
jgi:hypothetical protein